MQDPQKLRVWQLAHELSVEVARALTARGCRHLPGFRSQTIRSSASVPWNIAEGCAKATPEEFHRFLEMALGSLLEVQNQLLYAHDNSAILSLVYRRLERRYTVLRRMLIALMLRVLASPNDAHARVAGRGAIDDADAERR